MNFKLLSNCITFKGLPSANVLNVFGDSSFIKLLSEIIEKKFYVEPIKEAPSRAQTEVMTELEKALYTICCNEQPQNPKTKRWAQTAQLLLKNTVQERMEEKLQEGEIIYKINYHRGYLITFLYEAENSSQAQAQT